MRLSAETEGKLREAIDVMPMSIAGLSDEFLMNQLLLAGNMVIETANALFVEVTPKRFRDFEFAMNDFTMGCEEQMPPDRRRLEKCLAMLQEAMDEVRAVGSLPAEVIARMRALRDALAERNREIERRRFVPKDVDPGPLPHEAPALVAEAAQLRTILNESGFETPWLDELAATSSELGVLAAEQAIEEIDAIVG